MHTNLIDSAKLLTIIGEPTTLVFDCRHELTNPEYGITNYQTGHLPNAVFACMEKNLSRKPDGTNGRHPLPSIHLFSDWLSECGVTDTTQVVAYDDAGGVYASRLWWMLRWVGHDAVAVLDGGIQDWVKHGGSIDLTEPHRSPRCTFELQPRNACVDANFILTTSDRNEMLVIDAMANYRFHGRNEAIDPVAGHIPGAVNRFFKNNLNEAGKFRSPSELKTSFEQIMGDTPSYNVIHQCGSGVTACHNLLAMEVAGLHDSKLYPGSWSEWISDPTRPVSTE